jgi:hypothetical protein
VLGDVGYLVFRHRQKNTNPRSRGKMASKRLCVCVRVCGGACVRVCVLQVMFTMVTFGLLSVGCRIITVLHTLLLTLQLCNLCAFRCTVNLLWSPVLCTVVATKFP